MLTANNLNLVDLRDARYNQIIHMVSAANGAEEFYTIEVRTSCGTRREGNFSEITLLFLSTGAQLP